MATPNRPKPELKNGYAAAPAAAQAKSPSQRSVQRRRLASTHQTAKASTARTGPHIMVMKCVNVAGTIQPGTVMSNHSAITITTPGHRRKRVSPRVPARGESPAVEDACDPVGRGSDGSGRVVSLIQS